MNVLDKEAQGSSVETVTSRPLPGVKRSGREADGLLRGDCSCRAPEDNQRPITLPSNTVTPLSSIKIVVICVI